MTQTVDALLRDRAERWPDRCFLRFRDQELSYAQADARTSRIAGGLAAAGVRRGDLVAALMANSAEMALTWFAAARLGAALAPVNTGFRGPGLAAALNLTGARVLVADVDLCEALEGIASDLEHLRRLIVRGDDSAARARLSGVQVSSFAALDAHGAVPPQTALHPSDLGLVLFTSGTTGRSKGCMLSHRYAVRQAELLIEHYELRTDDVLYCPFPLFHLDATVLTVMPALVLGTTAAIGDRFSVSGFWDEVRAFGATVFDFMGATLTMLHKAAPAPEDADNPARLAWGVPVPEFAPEFEARFGLRLVELYGSTDVGIPIYEPLHEPRRTGSCGKAIAAYDVRLFDPADQEVEVGEVGEIVVRPQEPSLISDGYLGMPDATLAASRNLWFHTGDLARRDADGCFYFVGRGKEAIRRRGENISAFEVEEVVGAHPDVLDVAAYGVPSELSEEEVMVAVVARPGAAIDPAGLIEFCRPRMARHMVPRYVEVVDALPRTPTEKVEKYRLIERGLGPATFDREAPS